VPELRHLRRIAAVDRCDPLVEHLERRAFCVRWGEEESQEHESRHGHEHEADISQPGSFFSWIEAMTIIL
jgi:hypothetical protein